MPKQNDVHSKANRRTKKISNKQTFNKYGKNTSRGLRIKRDQMRRHRINIQLINKSKKEQKRHKYKKK